MQKKIFFYHSHPFTWKSNWLRIIITFQLLFSWDFNQFTFVWASFHLIYSNKTYPAHSYTIQFNVNFSWGKETAAYTHSHNTHMCAYTGYTQLNSEFIINTMQHMITKTIPRNIKPNIIIYILLDIRCRINNEDVQFIICMCLCIVHRTPNHNACSYYIQIQK